MSKDRDDVVFFAVNAGDEKAVIAKYWTDEGFKLAPVRQDGHAVSEAFGVRAYPTNYVLGPDGKVVWRSVGYDEAAIRKAIASTAKK